MVCFYFACLFVFFSPSALVALFWLRLLLSACWTVCACVRACVCLCVTAYAVCFAVHAAPAARGSRVTQIQTSNTTCRFLLLSRQPNTSAQRQRVVKEIARK